MDTYLIRTFGCQMNKHDSERIAGLLAADGLRETVSPEEADVIVFNTCCVREKAEERFRGQLASLSTLSSRRPDLVIAVGGCVAQKDGEGLLDRFPHVDVVFGTHNLHDLPDAIARAREERGSVVVVDDEGSRFASDLPSRRERPWHAWLPVTVGCDNGCTYCIVPRVRGGERSRAIEDVVAEAERLVADGVVEITLLGQNVNSYGRDLYGEPRFADILQRVAGVGVERLRFTTSHPKDLTSEIIRAMARTPQVCSHLHLPLQSGSTRILTAMDRGYTKADYLTLVDRLRDAIPHLALSTDIMVGFPGEEDRDFQDTLDVVRYAGYHQAFTFIFSPRPGTPAADMSPQVPREIVQERFERLVDLVNASAIAANQPLVGTVQRVLVEGSSKRHPDRLLARTASNKVVHAPFPTDVDPSSLEGEFIDVEIQAAHTWFLEGRLWASNA